MQAGELKQKIQFFKKPIKNDADGFSIGDGILYYSCYAKVTNQSGTEILKANAEFAETKTRFLIRYTKNPICENMYIVFNNVKYDITYINNYEFSNKYIEVFGVRRGINYG